MGFHIIENFNYPFIAVNIGDFWRRWHISLSEWCRSYVYTPIASYTRKPIIAVLAAMLVLGLWHELSFRFLCWGLFHGIGISLWHLFQRLKERLPRTNNRVVKGAWTAISVVITVNFVALSFILAKEPDLASAYHSYRVLLETVGRSMLDLC
jgi:alginate O-acetyltransferase complex protein AlgI